MDVDVQSRILDISVRYPIPALETKDPFVRLSQNTDAVCFLVQNRPFTPQDIFRLPRERADNRIHLFFRSIQHLLENAPPNESFDVHVFHEGDLTPEQHVQLHTLSTDRRPIHVHEIRFEVPPHVDRSLVERQMKRARKNKVPAYRTMGYRHMCSFYSFYVYPLFLSWGYRKLMRLDDDSVLLRPVRRLFSIEKDYVYRLTMEEDQRYMEYFEPFLRKYFDRLTEYPREIVFNNFFLLNLDIYRDSDIRYYLSMVYSSGGVYYCRWGDAVVQSYMLLYMWKLRFSIMRLEFSYEKWGYPHEGTEEEDPFSPF